MLNSVLWQLRNGAIFQIHPNASRDDSTRSGRTGIWCGTGVLGGEPLKPSNPNLRLHSVRVRDSFYPQSRPDTNIIRTLSRLVRGYGTRA